MLSIAGVPRTVTVSSHRGLCNKLTSPLLSCAVIFPPSLFCLVYLGWYADYFPKYPVLTSVISHYSIDCIGSFQLPWGQGLEVFSLSSYLQCRRQCLGHRWSSFHVCDMSEENTEFRLRRALSLNSPIRMHPGIMPRCHWSVHLGLSPISRYPDSKRKKKENRGTREHPCPWGGNLV